MANELHTDVRITLQCVGCKRKVEVSAGEVEPEEVPMCKNCFSPMVAVKGATVIVPGGSRR